MLQTQRFASVRWSVASHVSALVVRFFQCLLMYGLSGFVQQTFFFELELVIFNIIE